MPLPTDKKALEAAGYVYDNDGTCRGCGLPIEWWITPNNKKMPTVSPQRGAARVTTGASMIEFTVYGRPIPQGSTRAFIPKGWKRPIITSANAKIKPWRQQISGAAFDLALPKGWTAHQDRKIGIGIWLTFYLARPASLAKKIRLVTTKPDQDKLARAVNDGLTGILYVDDSQIVESFVRKAYGTPERVEIRVVELNPGAADVPYHLEPLLKGGLFNAESE